MSYETLYQKLFADAGLTLHSEDACSAEALEAAEDRLGVRLPEALRDYYRVAGNHTLGRAHNRLLSLSELAFEGDYLVFMEENQSVIFWAIPRSQLGAKSPEVWRGENALQVTWESDRIEVVDFLSVMFYWQAVCGGAEYSGIASHVPLAKRAVIEQHYRFARAHNQMQFFTGASSVIVLHGAEEALELMACSSSLEQFQKMDERLGIDWDWSTLDDLQEADAEANAETDESLRDDPSWGIAKGRKLPEA